MNPSRILVVEDDETQSLALTTRLESLGYETLLAYSGLILGLIAACAVPIVSESYRHLSPGELLLGSWMMPVYCVLYLIGELVFRTRKFAIKQSQTEAEESRVE